MLIKLNDKIYVNPEHISEVGIDRRSGEWFVQVLGDEDTIYIEAEEKDKLLSHIVVFE